MRASRTGIVVLAIGLMASPVPVFAHHGTYVLYDMDRQITLTGTVTEWRFTNPHVRLSIQITGGEGDPVQWEVEGNSVYSWTRSGWNRSSVRPGMEVTVTVHPAKAGTPEGVLAKIVLPNGRELAIEAGDESP